ncbi:hypothetical protein ABZ915_19440 [Streptomyces sp. NPDC046915]|uniref:hypothetical protein n=1 Tax=Streptomyces sp. NPDC046915 TaxID=3155257 RepID=UPI0033FE6D16
MTSDTDRPRWRSALRNFSFFLAGGSLGTFAYATLTRRPGGVPWGWVPWGWMLLGALACATLGALRPRRHRR